MEISDAEVRDLIQIVVGRTGRAVGINAQPKVGANAVINEIRSRDPRLADALSSFLDACLGWLDFHKCIEADGRQGAMTPEEFGEIVGHANARNQARKRLLAELEHAEAVGPK
jgi:hypothetical protein